MHCLIFLVIFKHWEQLFLCWIYFLLFWNIESHLQTIIYNFKHDISPYFCSEKFIFKNIILLNTIIKVRIYLCNIQFIFCWITVTVWARTANSKVQITKAKNIQNQSICIISYIWILNHIIKHSVAIWTISNKLRCQKLVGYSPYHLGANSKWVV